MHLRYNMTGPTLSDKLAKNNKTLEWTPDWTWTWNNFNFQFSVIFSHFLLFAQNGEGGENHFCQNQTYMRIPHPLGHA